MGNAHEGDVVVVTGAAGGIGSAYAAAFLSEGAKAALVDVSQEGLDRLEEKLAEIGGAFRSYLVNLADFDAVADLFARIEVDLGPARIVVNNAGVGKILPVLETTEAEYNWLVDNNLKQAFAVAKEAARQMMSHKLQGRIINIASLAGLRVIMNLTAYSMAKAGVIHMTHCMAKEWGGQGINVNCVCPGFFDTTMNHALWQTEQGKSVLASLPRQRLGLPEDIVHTVLFLAGPGAHYINGTVVTVDDGIQHALPF